MKETNTRFAVSKRAATERNQNRRAYGLKALAEMPCNYLVRTVA